ncbi:MAG: hypothetical protein H6728_01995 [Myxococcales bacterium]|nr:hypothetical protein [Myxococcales bacterium]
MKQSCPSPQGHMQKILGDGTSEMLVQCDKVQTPRSLRRDGRSWLFGMLCVLGMFGCRQLPEKLPTIEDKPSQKRLVAPANVKDNPLLPLPQRSTRELRLSLRKKQLLVVAPPSFRDPKLFPCSACHTGEPNRKKRKLTKAHEDHKMLHGGEHMWCFHCHAPNRVDQLRLADDTNISFESSHLLCFQCHGDKTREWVAGVHGRTVGYWRGPKRYLLCTHCHDPHDPKPKKIRPMPMPIPPHRIQTPHRRVP